MTDHTRVVKRAPCKVCGMPTISALGICRACQHTCPRCGGRKGRHSEVCVTCKHEDEFGTRLTAAGTERLPTMVAKKPCSVCGKPTGSPTGTCLKCRKICPTCGGPKHHRSKECATCALTHHQQ